MLANALAVSSLFVAALALGGCGSSLRAPDPVGAPAAGELAAAAAVTPPVSDGTTPTPVRSTPEPAVTELATLTVAAPASLLPGGLPIATVPASWYGYPSVLPVLDRRPGWLLVREAQRPNDSTAWIPAADATLSSSTYYLVADLSTLRMTEFHDGYPVSTFPTGAGAPSSPTATGHFFVTMKVPAPSSGYGPFVLVTSGHSNTITDWEESGDAIVAIHGPIDATADRLIGATGARVSEGCLRLHDGDLARLADIPAGTPLDIRP